MVFLIALLLVSLLIHLPPVDVGIFLPLQKSHEKQVDRLISEILRSTGNFILLLVKARTKTYAKENSSLEDRPDVRVSVALISCVAVQATRLSFNPWS